MNQDTFVRRFLQSEDMRAEFPDPIERREVAEKTYLSLSGDVSDVYEATKLQCCALYKMDVPEVQAVIAILMPAFLAHWRSQMTLAVGQAERLLAEQEDFIPTSGIDGLTEAEDEDRVFLVLLGAFLLGLERAATAPLPDELRALLSRASSGLLDDGASSVGFELSRAQDPLLLTGAIEELRLVIAGRVLTRRDEIRDVGRDFLTNRRARTVRDVAFDSPAELGRARSLQEWRESLTSVVGIDDTRWLRNVIDVWAYRWYAVAQFRAGRQARQAVARASAVLDANTTPFCRWVDGRIISIARAERQIDRHLEAAAEGDIEAVMSNWPLLPASVAGGAQSGFAGAFRGLGLPPYHFGCRTGVRWSLV